MAARPPLPLRRYLGRALVGLMIVSLLVMGAGAWWLILGPALEELAGARVAALETRARVRVQALTQDAERLARVAADWLARDEPALDHRSLNRRFMPLLAQYPAHGVLRVTDTAGNEWSLARDPEGGWRNRLTAAGNQQVNQRVLIWQDPDRLRQDRREPSDYQPLAQPWFKGALEARPGQIPWTEVFPLPGSGGPASILALPVPPGPGRPSLVVALEVDLGGLLEAVRPHDPAASLILFSGQGRLLGHHRLPLPESRGMPAPFSSVVALESPLAPGIRAWLGRGSEPLADRLFLEGLKPWYVGFRTLPLGDETLWLGVYLPLSELLPGLPARLLALTGLLILVLGLGYLVAWRLARGLGQPLRRFATDLKRLEGLDFSPPPPLPCQLEEIIRLAAAQERARRALGGAWEARRQAPAPPPSGASPPASE